MEKTAQDPGLDRPKSDPGRVLALFSKFHDLVLLNSIQ